MALVVENGSGVSGAESYSTVAEMADYASKFARPWLNPSTESVEAALRQGTRYIDGLYRDSYSGQRVNGRKQPLEWPRNNAYSGCDPIASNEIPQELKQAVFDAAFRELAKPGSLMPDTNQGGSITEIKADTVSVSFGGGGLTGLKVYNQIGALIRPLLDTSTLFGSASLVRG